MVTNRQSPRHGDFIGRRIGGYTIDALLGEGGMGSVYVASNPRLGRKAAIKVISREYTQNAEMLSRFLREAQAVAALDDPNIIEVYDCHQFAEDGLTYIAMKFIEGHSLAALFEMVRPLPIDGAIAIALQVASGLDAAHELGIVHRDVKPANILISRRWRRRYFVTILDFGIAKLLTPYLTAEFRTKTSAVMGTISYMAPEQARGQRDVDSRADVYSLGVVLYEMLTGRKPYADDNLYSLIEKQARRAPFPRPRELRPEIPQIVDETLLEALEIDRNKRLPSMKEFAQRIVQGVPNGDRLLSTLAARLCVDRPMAPNEPTLVGDVESSITSWAPARTMAGARRAFLMPTMLAAAGLVVGGLTMRVATRHPTDTRVTAPDVASSPPPPRPAVPPVNSLAPAATATTVVASDRAAMPQDAGVAAQAVPDARPAEVATPKLEPRPEPRTPPKPPGKPTDRSVATREAATKPSPASAGLIDDESVTRGSSGAAVKTGFLVVRTQTWADVYVDGRKLGTAPRRFSLAVGHYSVRVAHEEHEETLQVDVTANTDAVITKNW